MKKEEYAQALRHLRALIQEAMETVCSKKKIDLTIIEHPSINKISDRMLKEKIIDDKLHSWFLAFSSVANISSHKIYPNPQELEKHNIKNRTLNTLSLGMHLIYELEWIFYSKKKTTIDGEIFEFYGLDEFE